MKQVLTISIALVITLGSLGQSPDTVGHQLGRVCKPCY